MCSKYFYTCIIIALRFIKDINRLLDICLVFYVMALCKLYRFGCFVSLITNCWQVLFSWFCTSNSQNTKFLLRFFASAFSLVVKLYDVRNPWIGSSGNPTIEDLSILIFHKARLPKQRVVSYSFSLFHLCYAIQIAFTLFTSCISLFYLFLFLSLVV